MAFVYLHLSMLLSHFEFQILGTIISWKYLFLLIEKVIMEFFLYENVIFIKNVF